MAYVQNYYDLEGRCFVTTPGPNRIATPAYILHRLQEDQRAGKPAVCDANGTPVDVLGLLTLDGMRNAWLDELREQRAPILNALNGVWIDAHGSGNVQLQAEVAAARSFLKNMPADPDLLAVQPGTGAGQGVEYMRALTLQKYLAYASTASVDVRNAFREIS